MDNKEFNLSAVIQDVLSLRDYINVLSSRDISFELESRISGFMVTHDNMMRFIHNNDELPWEFCTYKETVYSINDVKIRKREYDSQTIITSKTQYRVVRYPDDWIKICLSGECELKDIPYGSEILIDERNIQQYIATFDNIMIDIKFISSHPPIVEVELCDMSDESIDKFVTTSIKMLYALQEHYMTKEEYTSYIHLLHSMNPNIDITNGFYPKPITLTVNDMNKININDYYVTTKTDGERCWLLGMPDKILQINVHGVLQPISLPNYTSRSFFLIDCECMNDTFVLLDVLFINTIPIHNLLFEIRQKYFKDISDLLHIQYKVYHRLNQNYVEIARLCWKSRTTKCDGLIIIENKQYHNSRLFKWKKINTVDLLVRDNKLWSHDEQLISDITIEGLLNNEVYEFEYLGDNNFAMIRSRHDKRYANKYNVIINNLHNALKFNVIDRACHNMRIYHNKVRRDILDKLATYGKTLLHISTTNDILDKFKQVYCINTHITNKKRNVTIISEKLSDITYTHRHDVVSIFFTINMLDDDDFIRLRDILRNKCPIAVLFIDHDIVKVNFPTKYTCNDYSIYSINNRFVIDIPDSSIRHKEGYIITRSKLVDFMTQLNYQIYVDQQLNRRSNMNDDEYRLSSCYRAMMFA